MDSLKVFIHLIYECKKGVRGMALCTLPAHSEQTAVRKLDRNGMAYLIIPLTDDRFNIFFGWHECIDVVKLFATKPLNMLTPEEDFILGTLLGYGVLEQCRRYCKRSSLVAV